MEGARSYPFAACALGLLLGVGTLPTLAADKVVQPSASGAASRDLQASISLQHDDNVTRASDGFAQPSDQVLSADIRQRFFIPMSEHTRGILDLQLEGKRYREFHGLSRLTGGVRGEVQYRSAATFDTPTFALFAEVNADQYASAARDGVRYGIGLSVQQNVTDRISVFGSVSHQGRQARNTAFDQQYNAVKLNLDYAVTNAQTLYLGAEYRRGDSHTTTRPSLLNTGYASFVYQNDDAYTRQGFYTYRYKGDTLISTLGYNISLNAFHALDFSWVRARSTPDVSGPASTPHYLVNQFSIAYLFRF